MAYLRGRADSTPKTILRVIRQPRRIVAVEWLEHVHGAICESIRRRGGTGWAHRYMRHGKMALYGGLIELYKRWEWESYETAG